MKEKTLTFSLDAGKNYSLSEFSRLDTASIMNDDRHFTIFVGEKIFFDDPFFPILEFTQHALRWISNPIHNLVFQTIDDYQQPTLSFMRSGEEWTIFSVWQEFECTALFRKEEIAFLIRSIILTIIDH